MSPVKDWLTLMRIHVQVKSLWRETLIALLESAIVVYCFFYRFWGSFRQEHPSSDAYGYPVLRSSCEGWEPWFFSFY